MGTQEVMDRYIAAIRGGRREDAFALFADDVVGHVPGRSAMAGTLEGRDAVMGYIQRIFALGHENVEVEVLDQLVGREHMALMVRERIAAPRRTLEIRRANFYRVQGGRITEIWIFEHDQYEVDEWLDDLLQDDRREDP